MEAYSVQFKCTVFIALPCKQWSCRHCAEIKIRRLAGMTFRAKPNRLLTLTIDPQLYDNPRHAFDQTRRKVPELMRFLRTRYTDIEYLRVTELTKGGWPHYHLLVRSPYIPHSVVKDKWSALTGALIVDIRKVKGTLNTYTYLVKYLSKMHKIGWTERHVSYSRKFFAQTDKEIQHDFHLDEKTIIEAHPCTYLYARFRGATLTMLGPNLFALDPNHDAVQDTIADDDYKTCAELPCIEEILTPLPSPDPLDRPHSPPPAPGRQTPLFLTHKQVDDV